ncbi:MAG: hypothetical protein PHN64_10715 [Desulfovibrionaceae bacterium]|nr:hypothetical protein [Desulfovibrionaceae bacterium]
MKKTLVVLAFLVFCLCAAGESFADKVNNFGSAVLSQKIPPAEEKLEAPASNENLSAGLKDFLGKYAGGMGKDAEAGKALGSEKVRDFGMCTIALPEDWVVVEEKNNAVLVGAGNRKCTVGALLSTDIHSEGHLRSYAKDMAEEYKAEELQEKDGYFFFYGKKDNYPTYFTIWAVTDGSVATLFQMGDIESKVCNDVADSVTFK